MNYHALLFCPDEKTARVVTQVLNELEFKVENCSEPFGAVKLLMARPFDAIVVDCDNEQNSALLFKSARNSASNQNSLAVAVVEGQAGVAKAFRIGANLVLTKPINVEQSKGTLRVARGLLKKAESDKTVSTAYAAPKTASPAPDANPPVGRAASASVGLSNAGKSGFAPFLAEIPNISAAAKAEKSTSSFTSFDIQQEPIAGPDPTETAFLESIPAAKPVMHFEKSAATAKESPWRQIAKPVGETVSRETPAAVKPVNRVGAPAASTRHPFSTGSVTGAAAAAPAKEKERPVTPEPAAIKPSAHSFEIDDEAEDAAQESPILSHAQPEAKRSRMPIIAALAVITLAAAAYFAWDKIHGNAVRQTNASSVAVPVTAPTVTIPETVVSQPDASAPQSAPAEIDVLSDQAQSPATKGQLEGANPAKPARVAPSQHSQKTSDSEITSDSEKALDSENTSDVVVKSFAPKKAANATVTPSDALQATAPPSLQASANSNDQAIAGLVAPTAMPVLKHTNEVLKVSQGITEGMLLKKVAPVYPAQAVQMHKHGMVILSANIGKNGSITSAKVLQGDSLLSQSALAAVKKWKYKPYLLNGQPIEVQTQISVNFTLP